MEEGGVTAIVKKLKSFTTLCLSLKPWALRAMEKEEQALFINAIG